MCIEDLVRVKANVIHSDFLKGDIMRMRYNYAKAQRTLGFKPSYSLEQGVGRLDRVYAVKIPNQIVIYNRV